MKHASAETLDLLEPFLGRIRSFNKLTQKRPGIFYKGSKAFVHFHEDPQGIFADLWVASDWQRFRVSDQKEQEAFLKAISSNLG